MNVDILNKPLLKSLVDGIIPFYELMNAYSIKTSLTYNLPSTVLGFIYVSKRGNYHLLLNATTSYDTQCKTFIHELKHITYDLPKCGYIIGFDMQYSYFERESDMVAESITAYISNKSSVNDD